MLSLFDYIFYRAYKFGLGRTSAPLAYAAGIVSIVQFFALLSIFIAINSFLEYHASPNRLIYGAAIVLLLAFNWYRYERNPWIDQLDEKWRDDDQRKTKGWLVIFIIAILLLSPFIIAKVDFDSRHPEQEQRN